jgi:SAM-dependent methyltransferase
MEAWGLTGEEVDYISIQQGMHCLGCKSNIRSIVLAKALLRWWRFDGTLSELVASQWASTARVLEVNEAGTLTPWLSGLPGHRIVRYPEFDMMNPAVEGPFDVVLHSDTLEHVPDPVVGLSACRGLLAPGGACVFTVPIIVGRLSRSRRGLPPSYHGYPGCTDEDQRVHTEFGADAWTYCMLAGYESCELVAFHYPAGLALIARP